jgi:hypothetical protein
VKLIGRYAWMCIDGSYVLHLILDVASNEFLRFWAINNDFERKWYKLLNLETGRIDVWPETSVRINIDRSL